MKKVFFTITAALFLAACNGDGNDNVTTTDSLNTNRNKDTSAYPNNNMPDNNSMRQDSLNRNGVKPDTTMRQ